MRWLALSALVLATTACGSADDPGGGPPTNTDGSPAAGYADGRASVPAEGQAEDVSSPTTVVGTGTASSCTADAFVAAVAKGGVITFSCGSDPTTIQLSTPGIVFNDKGPKVVIDGGGKITLSGGGSSRILYMSTCDSSHG